jgi:hypothetical protein
MTTINYSGISPQAFGLLSAEAFHFLLKNNPNLNLVEVSYDDENGDEIFTPVTPPLQYEPDNCLALIDRTDDDNFLWVLYDDYASIEDPSDSLIEALEIMDAFSTRTQETRLFATKTGLYLDEPRLLEADFSFTTGEYIL